jgi:LuxR family transcriptional regulator, maltose regulon positive regulatory protein
MHPSRTLPQTASVAADSPWALTARDAIEGGDVELAFRQGDHELAVRTLSDLLICLAGSSFAHHRVDCLEMLALVEACRGNLTRAQELADAAEQLAAATPIPAKQRRVCGHLARAWVATERQELSAALHWLDRAARLEELRHDALHAGLALLLRARLMRDRGNPAAARRLLADRTVTAAWVRAEIDAEKAQLAAHRTDSHPAPTSAIPCQRATSRLLDMSDQGELRVQSVSSQVQRQLQRAERECSRGCPDPARALTLEALSLAEPETIRRPFAHAGPHVRTLLRNDGEIVTRATWLSPGDHCMTGTVPARVTGRLPDELTEREHEVLLNLAGLLSTQEIAATMFISVNTVRTHVRHILEKLTATRRNEAVRRARQLGLV